MFERHRDAAASQSEPTLPEYVAVLIVLGVFVATVLSLVGRLRLSEGAARDGYRRLVPIPADARRRPGGDRRCCEPWAIDAVMEQRRARASGP
jgi:hypothetical protein